MAPDTIPFTCPNCGVELKVPVSMAGVTGPCPNCTAQIMAPRFSPPHFVPYYPPPPVAYPQSYMAPAAVPAAAPPPVTASTPVAKTAQDRPLFKPRPAPLKVLEAPALEKLMKDATLVPASSNATSDAYRYGKKQLWRFRILVGATGVIVLLTGMALKGYFHFRAEPPPQTVKVRPIFPDAVRPPSATAKEAAPLAPPTFEDLTQPVSPETPATPPARIAQEINLPDARKVAMEVLGKFFAAGSLAERMPLIETSTPEAELARSCLASALPAATAISPGAEVREPLENMIDFVFNTEIPQPGTGEPQAYSVVVRMRGSQPPRVVADPFLDLYGGRLATYVADPSDQAITVRAVISPGAFCYDDHVPNREKKRTLKIFSHPRGKEVARAYFGDKSKFAEMLMDPSSSIHYGQMTPATFILRWNTEEDPKKPFLEIIEMKRLDWNA